MIYLKKNLTQLISKAVSRAFPVFDTAKILGNQTRTDYITNIPSEVFYKYQKENVTFGLFNIREIADCIFVNCDKQPYIKQITVSGTGELEILIDDLYILNVLNRILSSRKVDISLEAGPGCKYMAMELFNSKSIPISLARVLFVVDALKSCNEIQGNNGAVFVVVHDLLDQENSISDFIRNIEVGGNCRLDVDQTDRARILEIIGKMGIQTDLALTSDLYNGKKFDFSQDVAPGLTPGCKELGQSPQPFHSMTQLWPWVKYPVLKVLPELRDKKLNFFYKYYKKDVVQKLKTALKDSDQALVQNINFYSYGDAFFISDQLNPHKELFDTMKCIEKAFDSISRDYNIKYLSLAFLKYFLIKHPVKSTIKISADDIVNKYSRSLWGVICIYKQLEVQDELNPFEIAEIEDDSRSLYIHVCSLPDAIEDSLNELSVHFIIEWTETLCEMYIKSPKAPQSKPKIDSLVKILLEFTLSLLGIDLRKLYTKN